MTNRNTHFDKRVEDKSSLQKILDKFFSSTGKRIEHKFSSPYQHTNSTNHQVFELGWFLNEDEIFVCFPNGSNGLDVYLSKNQNNLTSFLTSEETIDFETDIYLFSKDFSWCIRYIDEFYPDGTRMTFYHSDVKLEDRE